MAALLRSGPVNLSVMAAWMTRDARKSPKRGAGPPVEGFDTVGQCQRVRPSDRADLLRPLQPDQQVLTLATAHELDDLDAVTLGQPDFTVQGFRHDFQIALDRDLLRMQAEDADKARNGQPALKFACLAIDGQFHACRLAYLNLPVMRS